MSLIFDHDLYGYCLQCGQLTCQRDTVFETWICSDRCLASLQQQLQTAINEPATQTISRDRVLTWLNAVLNEKTDDE